MGIKNCHCEEERSRQTRQPRSTWRSNLYQHGIAALLSVARNDIHLAITNLMNKPKVFIIGGTGLIGSKIIDSFTDYDFVNLSIETGVDITNPAALDVIARDKECQIVLHLAAKADVDGCEKDKPFGENGAAYKINVLGTKNIVDACMATNKKIIYISTDFVFDGEETPKAGYTEDDKPHPINWYAVTKYKGEEIVQNSGLPFIIARLAYPYRQDSFALKKDFVHAILDRLLNQQKVMAVTDHIMTPTYVDDIAVAISELIKANTNGIYHVTGSEHLSPYEAALKIADVFQCDSSLIIKTTRAEYFKDRAPRPFNLTMNSDKIQHLGVKMRGFEEGLSLLL